MTQTQSLTLWDFFVAAPGLGEAEAKVICESYDVARLRKRLPSLLPSHFWSAVLGAIEEKVKTALNTPISAVFEGAWAKYAELLKYTDADKYGPDETVLVPLKHYRITSVQKPSIELLFDNQKVGEIPFVVELTLEVDAGTLNIRAGRIWEIRVGSCSGTGTIKFHEITLKEAKTQVVKLPGAMVFERGLPIRPL